MRIPPDDTMNFDRNAHQRNDHRWLTAAISDPQSRYLVFHKGRALIQDRQLAWLAPDSSLTESPPVFLGMLDGVPRFAVTVNQAVELDNAKHMDTRRIGPHLSEAELAILCQAQSMLHWHHNTRFCERCGHALQSSMAGDKRSCQNCSHEVFPRLNPVVIMVVEDDDRILLGRQPQFPAGMYSCLAGFVEHGETIEAAVIREVLEESQIRVSDIQYVASQAWPFPAQLMIGCIAKAENKTIVTDAELEDAQWFDRKSIGQMLDFSHPKGYTIPPRIAIAHQLIQGWYSREPDRSSSPHHHTHL